MEQTLGRTQKLGQLLGIIGWAIGYIPIAACLCAAVGIWLVFRPGIFTPDSIMQIDQAVAGRFNDHHPPVMAIFLSLILPLGAKVSHVVLAQCLLGVLGVFCLAREVIRSATGESLGAGTLRWTALFATLILLCPISPLAVHLAAFWKDVWELIALCWVCVFLLRGLNARTSPAGLALLAGLLLAMTLSVLVRHNAVALLPVYGLIIALLVGKRLGRWAAAAAFFLPAVLFVSTDQALRRVWHVEATGISRIVQALDMVDMCAANPAIEAEAPFVHSFLLPNFRVSHIPGIGDNTLGHCVNMPRYGHIWSAEGLHQFQHEYWQAIRKHPLDFARARRDAFAMHLVDHHTNQTFGFPWGIFENHHGLAFQRRTENMRQRFWTWMFVAYEHPIYQWAFTRHVVWLFICAIGVVPGVRALVRRNWCLVGIALAWLIALSYMLTYLLASFDGEFRYMYPASLVAQTVTAAILVGGLLAIPRWLLAWVRARGRGTTNSCPPGANDPNVGTTTADWPAPKAA